MKDQGEPSPRRNSPADPGPEAAPPALRTDRTDLTDHTDRLTAEVEALSHLCDATSRLWHLSDLKTGLEEILSAAIALLGGDKGTVQLLGDDGLLRIVAQHGFDERFLEYFRAVAPDHNSAAGRALRSRQRQARGRGPQARLAQVVCGEPLVSVPWRIRMGLSAHGRLPPKVE